MWPLAAIIGYVCKCTRRNNLIGCEYYNNQKIIHHFCLLPLLFWKKMKSWLVFRLLIATYLSRHSILDYLSLHPSYVDILWYHIHYQESKGSVPFLSSANNYLNKIFHKEMSPLFSFIAVISFLLWQELIPWDCKEPSNKSHPVVNQIVC